MSFDSKKQRKIMGQFATFKPCGRLGQQRDGRPHAAGDQTHIAQFPLVIGRIRTKETTIRSAANIAGIKRDHKSGQYVSVAFHGAAERLEVSAGFGADLRRQ